MTIEEKRKIRNAVTRFIKNAFEDKASGKKANTKLKNICNKTGKYDVPTELFQKRTLRRNRVIIPWKEVESNNITVEQLKTFSGGVAVEFINEDFFTDENKLSLVNKSTFNSLKSKIGSNEQVSAIISFRSEDGEPSSKKSRLYFEKFLNHTEVNYRNKTIEISQINYKKYLLKAVASKKSKKIGNDAWSGFLFYSIKGGEKLPIESHPKKQLRLFNPACEFATEQVSIDIDLVMLYFAFLTLKKEELPDDKTKKKYDKIFEELKFALQNSKYNSDNYIGNLLDYCNNHMSVILKPGFLTDPIQACTIEMIDFSIDDKNDKRNLDFTHEEAVKKKKYYWDKEQNCILSAARPTNVFWSKHSSNMMQQDMSLDEYFNFEADNIKRRKRLIKKARGS